MPTIARWGVVLVTLMACAPHETAGSEAATKNTAASCKEKENQERFDNDKIALVTFYHCAVEKDGAIAFVDENDFFCGTYGVVVQGCGERKDGSFVKAVKGRGSLGKTCKVGSETWGFVEQDPTTAAGTPPVAWRTIAASSEVCTKGQNLKISLPWGQDFCAACDDVGGAIKGESIDIFASRDVDPRQLTYATYATGCTPPPSPNRDKKSLIREGISAQAPQCSYEAKGEKVETATDGNVAVTFKVSAKPTGTRTDPCADKVQIFTTPDNDDRRCSSDKLGSPAASLDNYTSGEQTLKASLPSRPGNNPRLQARVVFFLAGKPMMTLLREYSATPIEAAATAPSPTEVTGKNCSQNSDCKNGQVCRPGLWTSNSAAPEWRCAARGQLFVQGTTTNWCDTADSNADCAEQLSCVEVASGRGVCCNTGSKCW